MLTAAVSTLSACGGGQADSPLQSAAAASAAATTGSAGTASAMAANLRLVPSYHLSPVLPGEPSAVDRDGSSASARMQPRSVNIPASSEGTSTHALTYQDLVDGASRAHALGVSGGTAAPMATAGTSVTYTPAQIRAAYGLPPVPSDLSKITALQAAQLGAGQTIYVADAFHDVYAFGELLAFSNLFGLPGCTQSTLAVTASLPMAPPSAKATTCEFYQVASGAGGTVAPSYPRHDPQWATEIALDIQWAHAIAPLARIVLVEAANDSMAAMSDAIQLVNRLGPGVLSMSFGGPEGSYVAANEALFRTPGMSYFASTGDNGAAVSWPAASPSVVAVGGTSLRYTGSGTRTETAWSLAGGGVSAYVPLPTYQNATLLRNSAVTRRSVADVSMNADPTTGQYTAIIPNQLTCTFCQVSWVTTGGTSLATPQWAGLAAVANALRAQAGKAPLGAPHAVLYQSLANSSTYASAFLDVVQGSNGSCPTCAAKAGYDGPTGLGTPNGMTLLSLMTNGSVTPATPVAPTVIPSTINGAYGQAISVTPSVSSMNPYTLSLTGAPAGMVVSGSTVNWPSPVAGTFNVKLTAKDTKTGLSGTDVLTVIVAPPPPPIVSGGSVTATAGKALSFVVSVGDRYPAKLSLVGAPAGMSLTAAGMNAATLNWPNPVIGTARFTLRADSTQTGLSAQGVYTVVVNPASAPLVSAGQIAAPAGRPLAAKLSVVAVNPYSLSLVGAPSGMTVDASGSLTWPSPIVGNYAVTVQARDSKTGLVGAAVVNVSIGSSTGPAIFSTVMSGVAGKPLSGQISVTDGGASLVGMGIAANHPDIKFTIALGMGTTGVSWAAPVAGNYTIQVSVTDSAGKATTASIPVVINAK